MVRKLASQASDVRFKSYRSHQKNPYIEKSKKIWYNINVRLRDDDESEELLVTSEVTPAVMRTGDEGSGTK